MNIYFVESEPIYPVGNAGALLVAASAESALSLAIKSGCQDCKTPICLGIANESEDKERIVFSNNGDY